MAVRTDIDLFWSSSPRRFIVDAPSTNLSIQDYVDTSRTEEEDLLNTDDRRLVKASGKQDLGAGTFVATTVESQDVDVGFQARKVWETQGTVSTADLTGRVLTDSGGGFAGVTPGAWIVNITDQSVCSALRIVSDTQIVTDVLGGGGDNEWGLNDVYVILNITVCTIDGGNYTAVDKLGSAVLGVLGTAGTMVVIAKSSSATIASQSLDAANKYLIESQRASHSAFGNVFYWDPALGDDANDGVMPTTARKTFKSIHDNLVVSGNHDVVFIVADQASTSTITEQIVISKDYTFLRGPGRDVVFRPLDDSAHTIQVRDCSGVELDSFRVETFSAGAAVDAIHVGPNATFCKMSFLWVEFSLGDGFHLEGGDHHTVLGCIVHSTVGAGALLNDTQQVSVVQNFFHDCGGWSLQQTASAPGVSCLTKIVTNRFRNGGSGEISIGVDVEDCIIGGSNSIADLVNDVLDNGTNTLNELQVRSFVPGATNELRLRVLAYNGSIWIRQGGAAGTVLGDNGTETNPVGNLADAETLAGLVGVQSYVFIQGSFTLTKALTEHTVELRDETELDLGGQSVNGTEIFGGSLKGVMSGTLIAREAQIEDLGPFRGKLSLCGINGTLKFAAGRSTLAHCYSEIAGVSTPVYDFDGVASEMSMRSHSGGAAIVNMTHADSLATAEFVAGQIIINASNTDGLLVVRGNVQPVTDTSAGTLVVTTGVVNVPAIADGVWDETATDHVAAGSTGLANLLVRYQGSVWVSSSGAAGAVPGVNGLPDNPCSSWADALTLAAALPLQAFVITQGSFALTASLTEWFVELRDEAELNFGGQSVNGSVFTGGILKGIMTGTVVVNHASLEDVSGLRGHISSSGFSGTNTLASGSTTLDNCHSHVPGTDTPTLKFVVGAKCNVRAFSGGWQVEDMTDVTNVATFGFTEGQLILDSSCTGGALVYRGDVYPVTDNSTGTTVVANDTATAVAQHILESGLTVDATLDQIRKTVIAVLGNVA